MYRTRLTLIYLLLAGLSGCTPLQTVRPLPDFVTLAIKPGDTVELVTTAGDRLTLEVNHVDAESLGSPEHLILLEEIDQLYLRSRERPPYPCGGAVELGCSIPRKVKGADLVLAEAGEALGGALGSVMNTLGNNWHSRFEEHFYDACVQHDFCYRHGYKTYGHDKEFCDAEFLGNMLARCSSTDVACNTAAREFSWAVREHAEDGAYRVENSSYCEYDGKPVPPAPGGK